MHLSAESTLLFPINAINVGGDGVHGKEKEGRPGENESVNVDPIQGAMTGFVYTGSRVHAGSSRVITLTNVDLRARIS